MLRLKKHPLVALTLLCWLLLSHQATARSFDDIIESQEIVVAVYRDFLPFSTNENGIASGIDIDVATTIANKLGVKLRLHWVSADENVEGDLRNNLWKGHFLNRTVADLMLRVPYDRKYSQLRDDIGELVHDRVHMFGPYHTESWQIIFNSKKIDDVTTMAMFQYHDIGVEIDSVPDFYLSTAFAGRLRERAKHFASTKAAVDAMVTSKVDAAMGLRSQITHFQQPLGDQFKLASNAFPMLGRQQWDIGMAVRDEYRQLGYAVGDVVTEMVSNGEMAAIFKRHHTYYQKSQYYDPQ
ncbi:MAG: transporter substrate-binding domain-containing protein [Gammaproteobacteria bacterium]|nr:transporter substrate-binding domain-containing protein [Gammaproteobacteria bacterium]